MTVVVPLDGSLFAERALPWARRLTQRQTATLVLVRAVAWHTGRASADQQALRQAEQYLSDVSTRLLPGRHVETVVSGGPADTTILDATSRYHADLLVMATHTRPPLAGLLYGSVARKLLGQSPVPSLLIRSWTPETEAIPSGGPSRILVPLDGSPLGEEALPLALAIAHALDASLALVRAVSPPERLLSGTLGLLVATMEADQEQLVTEAEQYLNGIRQHIASLAPRLTVQTEVRVGDALTAIVAAEREHGDTMVVMATHGRTGLGHLLLGSVAEGVLRVGAAPVVFVRPRSLRRATGAIDDLDLAGSSGEDAVQPTASGVVGTGQRQPLTPASQL